MPYSESSSTVQIYIIHAYVTDLAVYIVLVLLKVYEVPDLIRLQDRIGHSGLETKPDLPNQHFSCTETEFILGI